MSQEMRPVDRHGVVAGFGKMEERSWMQCRLWSGRDEKVMTAKGKREQELKKQRSTVALFRSIQLTPWLIAFSKMPRIVSPALSRQHNGRSRIKDWKNHHSAPIKTGIFGSPTSISNKNMSAPTPVDAPPHVLQLLAELHKKSLEQEALISDKGNVFSSQVLGDLEDKQPAKNPKEQFDELMSDKFIALYEEKCQFTYQLINAMGATNIVEAGTSFGVSTIYLALAVAKTTAATGKSGTVIATENEKEKVAVARKYWAQCGASVEQHIDLREGDLLETLKHDLPEVDLLLLDSELTPNKLALYARAMAEAGLLTEISL